MQLTDIIIELDGLIYRRDDYRAIRGRYGAGFDDSLAGQMLKLIEGDIEQRTGDLLKALKTEPFVLNQISARVTY